jgi:hypothetical protein
VLSPFFFATGFIDLFLWNNKQSYSICLERKKTWVIQPVSGSEIVPALSNQFFFRVIRASEIPKKQVSEPHPHLLAVKIQIGIVSVYFRKVQKYEQQIASPVKKQPSSKLPRSMSLNLIK